MSKGITESVVERRSLDWLRELGYGTLSGLVIAPGEPMAERVDYKQVFLFDRLQTKPEHVNAEIPLEELEEALRDALPPRLLSGELSVPATKLTGPHM